MMDAWEELYSKGYQLNMYPYPEIIRFCKRIKGEDPDSCLNALDVGCGSGVHSHLLSQMGWNVTAVDGSASSILFAKENFQGKFTNYICSDFSYFYSTLNPSKKFDVVVDRLSSTHMSKEVVSGFYSNPASFLNPKARVVWQGFDISNQHKDFALNPGENFSEIFSGGKFKDLGRACFYSETEVREVFSNFEFTSFQLNSVFDYISGLTDAFWHIEGVYNG